MLNVSAKCVEWLNLTVKRSNTMQLNLEQNELEFIIQVIAKLPTESNAYPLYVKVAQQYQEQKLAEQEKKVERPDS